MDSLDINNLYDKINERTNKRLNKFNNYYISQLKAIKNFVNEDNKQYVIDTLNDINLTNEKE